MANPFKFRADHFGGLVAPVNAVDREDAIIQALKCQREAGLSVASDGGYSRGLDASISWAADGSLAAAVAREVEFVRAHSRLPAKVMIPSPSRLQQPGHDAPVEAFRAAVTAAIASGAAYVQVDAASAGKSVGTDPLVALQLDLDALSGIDRSESTRLALQYAGETFEELDQARLDLVSAAPVDRLLITFREDSDFQRLASLDKNLDVALALLPIDVDDQAMDCILAQIDRAGEVIESERLALAPRVNLDNAGIDWARQYAILWMVTDAAMRWWGFEG